MKSIKSKFNKYLNNRNSEQNTRSSINNDDNSNYIDITSHAWDDVCECGGPNEYQYYDECGVCRGDNWFSSFGTCECKDSGKIILGGFGLPGIYDESTWDGGDISDETVEASNQYCVLIGYESVSEINIVEHSTPTSCMSWHNSSANPEYILHEGWVYHRECINSYIGGFNRPKYSTLNSLRCKIGESVSDPIVPHFGSICQSFTCEVGDWNVEKCGENEITERSNPKLNFPLPRYNCRGEWISTGLNQPVDFGNGLVSNIGGPNQNCNGICEPDSRIVKDSGEQYPIYDPSASQFMFHPITQNIYGNDSNSGISNCGICGGYDNIPLQGYCDCAGQSPEGPNTNWGHIIDPVCGNCMKGIPYISDAAICLDVDNSLPPTSPIVFGNNIQNHEFYKYFDLSDSQNIININTNLDGGDIYVGNEYDSGAVLCSQNCQESGYVCQPLTVECSNSNLFPYGSESAGCYDNSHGKTETWYQDNDRDGIGCETTSHKSCKKYDRGYIDNWFYYLAGCTDDGINPIEWDYNYSDFPNCIMFECNDPESADEDHVKCKEFVLDFGMNRDMYLDESLGFRVSDLICENCCGGNNEYSCFLNGTKISGIGGLPPADCKQLDAFECFTQSGYSSQQSCDGEFVANQWYLDSADCPQGESCTKKCSWIHPTYINEVYEELDGEFWADPPEYGSAGSYVNTLESGAACECAYPNIYKDSCGICQLSLDVDTIDACGLCPDGSVPGQDLTQEQMNVLINHYNPDHLTGSHQCTLGDTQAGNEWVWNGLCTIDYIIDGLEFPEFDLCGVCNGSNECFACINELAFNHDPDASYQCNFNSHTEECIINGWSEDNGNYISPYGGNVGDDINNTNNCCCVTGEQYCTDWCSYFPNNYLLNLKNDYNLFWEYCHDDTLVSHCEGGDLDQYPCLESGICPGGGTCVESENYYEGHNNFQFLTCPDWCTDSSDVTNLSNAGAPYNCPGLYSEGMSETCDQPNEIFINGQCLWLGDLNADGTLNALDVVILVGSILDGSSEYDEFIQAVGDVTQDGLVNVLDVSDIVDKIQESTDFVEPESWEIGYLPCKCPEWCLSDASYQGGTIDWSIGYSGFRPWLLDNEDLGCPHWITMSDNDDYCEGQDWVYPPELGTQNSCIAIEGVLDAMPYMDNTELSPHEKFIECCITEGGLLDTFLAHKIYQDVWNYVGYTLNVPLDINILMLTSFEPGPEGNGLLTNGDKVEGPIDYEGNISVATYNGSTYMWDDNLGYDGDGNKIPFNLLPGRGYRIYVQDGGVIEWLDSSDIPEDELVQLTGCADSYAYNPHYLLGTPSENYVNITQEDGCCIGYNEYNEPYPYTQFDTLYCNDPSALNFNPNLNEPWNSNNCSGSANDCIYDISSEYIEDKNKSDLDFLLHFANINDIDIGGNTWVDLISAFNANVTWVGGRIERFEYNCGIYDAGLLIGVEDLNIPYTIGLLTNMDYLKLENCVLNNYQNKLPQSMRHLVDGSLNSLNLINIGLSDDSFTDVNYQLQFNEISDIDLSGNNLTQIPSTVLLKYPNNISWLNMGNNPLSSIPESCGFVPTINNPCEEGWENLGRDAQYGTPTLFLNNCFNSGFEIPNYFWDIFRVKPGMMHFCGEGFRCGNSMDFCDDNCEEECTIQFSNAHEECSTMSINACEHCIHEHVPHSSYGFLIDTCKNNGLAPDINNPSLDYRERNEFCKTDEYGKYQCANTWCYRGPREIDLSGNNQLKLYTGESSLFCSDGISDCSVDGDPCGQNNKYLCVDGVQSLIMAGVLTLKLNGNGYTTMPTNLPTALQRLHVDNNQITTFEPGPANIWGGFGTGQLLGVNQTFPPYMNYDGNKIGIPGLLRLHMNNNNLTDIDLSILKHYTLKYLYLDNNSLNIDENYQELDRVCDFWDPTVGNPYDYTDHGFISLFKLSLKGNNLQTIPITFMEHYDKDYMTTNGSTECEWGSDYVNDDFTIDISDNPEFNMCNSTPPEWIQQLFNLGILITDYDCSGNLI